jgi:hypothetical protein
MGALNARSYQSPTRVLTMHQHPREMTLKATMPRFGHRGRPKWDSPATPQRPLGITHRPGAARAPRSHASAVGVGVMGANLRADARLRAVRCKSAWQPGTAVCRCTTARTCRAAAA